MNNKWYSLPDILNELLAKYYNPNEQDAANLRKKVESICRGLKSGNTNLWKKARQPHGQKVRYRFTAKEREEILKSDKLQAYIEKNKVSPQDYAEYLRLTTQNEKYQAALEAGYCGPDIDDTDTEGITVTIAEMHQKKMELMIEALYSLYYQPINENELWQDLLLDAARQEDNVTADCDRAREHLQQGIQYYCKRKNR